MTHLRPYALVTLVNEWGTRPRVEAGEQGQPFPDPGVVGLDAGADPDDLVRVADLLHPVFAAASVGERVRRLDALLVDTGLTVRLREAPTGQAYEEWEPARAVDALLVATLRTLTEVVQTRGPAAIGVCGGEECVDVWIDAPRGRPRRYCSSQCGGRVRVAAHRRRQRTEERA